MNQQCLLGPDKIKQFKQVVIKGIHVNRTPVEEANVGEFACFLLKCSKANEKLSKEDFRKGMVLLD